MSYARIASRVAVGGVATALATAGLVGVTGTPANAATVTSTYVCTVPVLGDKTFAVSIDTPPLLPPSAPAGAPVAAGLLSFKSVLTVPGDVVAAFGSSVNGAKSDDFSASIGTASMSAPVKWDTPGAANPDTSVPFSGTGANAAFVLPAAGTYSISMPKTFTLIPTKDGAALPFTAPCTSAAPSQIASITLNKQDSKVKAKAAPKSVDKGSVVGVKGKVLNDFSKTGGPVPTGKVIIKDGKKKVGKGKLKNGKFVVKVKGLGVGSHSLTVLYKGDDYTNKGTSKALKVTVHA